METLRDGVVLVRGGEDFHFTFCVACQPHPSAAELGCAGGVEFFLEGLEVAEGFLDYVADGAGGIASAHVATLTATKAAAVALMAAVTGLHLAAAAVTAGLAADAVSHYWADRRVTLARLAGWLGKRGFYELGAPRAGHDDAPHLGTGAYALDQSWHIAWLFIAALIITALGSAL